MSADAAPTDAGDSETDPDAERDATLSLLDDGIEEAHRKVKSGRVLDAENEKVRIQWIRALGYVANIKRQMLRDKQLDDLEARMDRIEEREGIDQ